MAANTAIFSERIRIKEYYSIVFVKFSKFRYVNKKIVTFERSQFKNLRNKCDFLSHIKILKKCLLYLYVVFY